MKDLKNLVRVDSCIPAEQKAKLKTIAERNQIFMSRLIGFLIDDEFQKSNPFEMDFSLPAKNYQGIKFPIEAEKIVEFMRTDLMMDGGLDILILLRHEIGIPDKKIFLAAFRECLDQGLIEPFKPRPKRTGAPYPKGYVHYRLVGRDYDYDRYLKLKKKFGREVS